MYGTFEYPEDNIRNDQDNASFRLTDEIFKAYVDAILPRTPGLAEEYGRIQYYGALDLFTDEYLIMSLNSLYNPIAIPTAEMLELAAEQLIFTDGYEENNNREFNELSIFGQLTPLNRFRVLTLLEQFAVNSSELPIPFQENEAYIHFITSALNRFTMMGYYSEWSGYGSTRLNTPNQRILENFPVSWEQVGYPGPSLGYRALR